MHSLMLIGVEVISDDECTSQGRTRKQNGIVKRRFMVARPSNDEPKVKGKNVSLLASVVIGRCILP